MVAPTITTIAPDNGLSLGETFVTITGTDFNDIASGGTIRVLFNGVPSPEFGVVDSTKLLALTPPGVLGAVDVIVENIPSGGGSEPTTEVGGFTYRRPRIATERDLAASEDNAILVVVRTLIADLRRTVISNVKYDTHPEYVDVLSAGEEQEVQAEAPSIKIVGPALTEDRFYAINGRFAIETVAGTPAGAEFAGYHQPVTVRLDFTYVGTARSKGEAINLWGALTRYFDRTPILLIPMDGSDVANGAIEIEMNPTWEQRASFTDAGRDGFVQFNGAFHLRGVQTIAAQVSDSRGADTIIVTPVPL